MSKKKLFAIVPRGTKKFEEGTEFEVLKPRNKETFFINVDGQRMQCNFKNCAVIEGNDWQLKVKEVE